MEEKELLTVKEAAKLLNVSTGTIRKYIKENKIVAKKILGIRYIRNTELEKIKKT
jgi:excisionase family DNA binding protein